MINNMEGQGKKVIKVCLWANIIFLIVSIFYQSKFLMILFSSINVILLFTFFMMEKHSSLFSTMIQTQKSSSILNNMVGKLNG